MKRVISLYYINDSYILSYTEDEEEKSFSSPSLNEIKSKCNEYGFSLDFTGAVDVNQ
jgi:hypothetical protein